MDGYLDLTGASDDAAYADLADAGAYGDSQSAMEGMRGWSVIGFGRGGPRGNKMSGPRGKAGSRSSRV